VRRIKIMEHITLDGVIQAPGGPDEDGDQRRPQVSNTARPGVPGTRHCA